MNERFRLSHSRIVTDRKQARNLRARRDTADSSNARQFSDELANLVSNARTGETEKRSCNGCFHVVSPLEYRESSDTVSLASGRIKQTSREADFCCVCFRHPSRPMSCLVFAVVTEGPRLRGNDFAIVSPTVSPTVRIGYNTRMKPDKDTPRGAFDLLSWRVNAVVVVTLVAVSFVAAISSTEQANSMRGMVMGLGQIGYRDPGNMGAVAFLAMWLTMMAAMMLPTIAPMVLAHHAVAHRRLEGALSTLAFVAGYLLVWSAIGLVVFAAYSVYSQWGDEAARSHWLLTLAGETLVFAGAYQFIRWK